MRSCQAKVKSQFKLIQHYCTKRAITISVFDNFIQTNESDIMAVQASKEYVYDKTLTV